MKKLCERGKNFILKNWSLIWFVGCVIVLGLFMIKHIDALLDSDMSSEMLLAKILSEENRVVTQSWFYSTELRVLNTQLIMAPLFKICDNWYVVRIVGSFILYILLLLSYYYFCRQITAQKAFVLSAAVLFLPFSKDYTEIVLYGLYYIPHIVISLAMFGMIFQWINSTKIYARVILAVFMALISIMAGMGGLRQLLIFYIPIVCTAIILLFIACKQDEKIYDVRIGFLKITLFSSVLAGAGYCINSKILYTKYFFHSYEEIQFTDLQFDRIFSAIAGFLRSFGYQRGEEIFSYAIISNGISVILLVLCIYCVWKILKRQIEINKEIYIVTLYFVIALIVFIGLYALTNTGYESRYNLPIIIFAVPIVAYCLQIWGEKKKEYSYACIILAFIMTVATIFNYEMYSSLDKTKEMKKVADFLVQKEYFEGYSMFWKSNVLVELSNGEIEVWTLGDENGINGDSVELDEIYRWLQPARHVDAKPKGKVFILLTPYESESYAITQCFEKTDVIYESDDYLVFGFENYEQLQEKINNR